MQNELQHPDESHRLATLRDSGILDSAPEESFDAIAQCAAQVTGSPMAAISLIDEQREWLKAVHGWSGLPVREIPRAISFCTHALAANGFFEIPDTSADTRFANNPFVTGAPHVAAYACEPIRVAGVTLGLLCVFDKRPRSLNLEQRAALASLARLASNSIHTRHGGLPADDERSRLLDFARASGDWMWETDADLRYTWVSGAFEAVTGLSPTSMKTHLIDDAPLLDRLGEPLGGPHPNLHGLLMRRQPITRVLTNKLTPKGVMQISRSAVPFFDAQGNFRGYRGTARDVSAIIATERRTHAQAELLNKLSSQVPGVIFQLKMADDGSSHYTYVSEASRDLFGAEPPHDQDDQHPLDDLMSRLLHPDDAADHIPSMLSAGRTLAPWHREFRIIRNGFVRWIEARAMPERHEDGGTLWHGFASDVTERKDTELALRSSEQRWSLAAEAAGIGITELELATGEMSLDMRACAVHRLTKSHRSLSLSDWLAVVHPDDRPTLESHLAYALSAGNRLETRYRLWERPSEDAEFTVLEMFAHCTRDTSDQITGLIGTCRDVTQHVAHERLQHEKESAERASSAKSEFLSRVSHELRTPLNGILGFAQLMGMDLENPLPPEQGRRLDSVLRAGRHLLNLINDMLDLARIEHGDFSLQPSAVDLAGTLASSFSLLQPLAESAGIHLIPPPTQTHWVQADSRALEQILLNLLSNAIKYNRPGGSVRVEVNRNARRIRVSVIDQGLGLTAAQRTHLFQPFNRLGVEQQKRVEGTGLGLVIARQLATAMKGELLVDSEPGKGSVFTLVLPAARPPSTSFTQEPDGEHVAVPPANTRRQVLYIEDDPVNTLLMQEVFRARPQWELHIAADGTSGLGRAQAQAYDLLLIDMNLPDMNGLQLIRRLRSDARTGHLQCIALSADAMRSQIDAALAVGFDDYWTKPINVTRLLDGLGRALAGADDFGPP